MMNKKFLVFDNVSEAKTFVRDADINMGYPKGRTLHYTKVTRYLVGEKFMVLVCSKCHGIMTESQIKSLKSRDEIILDGGLPIQDDF